MWKIKLSSMNALVQKSKSVSMDILNYVTRADLQHPTESSGSAFGGM